MILIKKIDLLGTRLAENRSAGNSLGFVPTMGALHAGHLSLVAKSKAMADVTVCSIFVNPTQFNNAADFENYPVTIAADIDALEKAGVDVLFMPAVNEMYPANETVIKYDLGELESRLEGKFRPGHFQGVCRIVDKLLQAVNPDFLFLGRKDFQQCLVIRRMMSLTGNKAHLEICDTVREADGLAMSSRNLRLSPQQRETAPGIFQALQLMKKKFESGDIVDGRKQAVDFLTSRGFKVDYAEIADAETLLPAPHGFQGKAVALIAAYLDEVRLIDNITLN